MASTDHIVVGNDYTAELDNEARMVQFQNQVEAAERQFTYEDALTLHNTIRAYPTIHPELALGTTMAGIAWDHPSMLGLNLSDLNQQAKWYQPVQDAVRGTFNLMDSLYEEGISRPIRTGVRMYQGESFDEAYANAGASVLSMQHAANQLGIKTTTGTGWIPTGMDYSKTPEFGHAFVQAGEAGLSVEEAFARAERAATEKYGHNIVPYQRDIAHQTQIHKTWGDETYSSPVSLGRLGAIQFFKPDTLPFHVLSGMVDVPSRVGLDPINAPFDELTRWRQARNTLIAPDVADAVLVRPDRQGRILRRGVVEEHPVVAGTSRGIYAKSHSPLIYEVEGFVFHGTSKGENVAGALNQGGLSFDLRRAQEYAQEAGRRNDDAVVYAYRVTDLPKEVRAQLSKGGDIEQLRPGTLKPLNPEELAEVTNLERRLDQLAEEAEELNAYLDEFFAKQKELEASGAHIEGHVEGDDFPLYSSEYVATQREINDLIDAHADVAAEMYELQLELGRYQPPIKETYIGDKVLSPTGAFTSQAIDDAIESGVLRFPDTEITTELPAPPAAVQAQVGIGKNWRPWVHPTRADDFLRKGRGQKIIRYIANTSSPRQLMQWGGLKDLPFEEIAKLARVRDEARVIEILAPHLGKRIDVAPRLGPSRALGTLMYADSSKGIRGGVTMFDPDAGLPSYLRRLKAESQGGIPSLDPHSATDAAWKVKSLMETYQAAEADIDTALFMIANRGGSIQGLNKVKEFVVSNFEQTMRARNQPEEFIVKALEMFNKEEELVRLYFNELNGAVINEFGENLKPIPHPVTGEPIEWPHFLAHLESQFSQSNVLLPSIREVRRGTSRLRRITNKAFRPNDPLALESSKMQLLLDYGLGNWRAFTLLRGGWMFRVLPDEIARALAGGMTPEDVGTWMGLILHPQRADIFGNDIDTYMRRKGLGAGTLEKMDAQLLGDVKGTRWDHRSVDWVMVSESQNQPMWRKGIATNIEHLFYAESAKVVAEKGVDEAMWWFRNTDEGKALLNRIAYGDDTHSAAAATSNWRKAATNDQFLYIKLQSIDAFLAQQAGGHFVYRRPLPNGQWGQWRTHAGNEIADIDAYLYANNVDASAIGDDVQFIVTDPGSTRFRQIIATGRDETGTVRYAVDMTPAEKLKVEGSLESFYDGGYRPPPTTRAPKNPTRPERTRAWVDKLFHALGQRPTERILRSPHAQLRYWEELGRAYVYSDDTIRGELLARARRLDAQGQFPASNEKLLTRGINKYLERSGLGKLPSGATRTTTQFGLEEIDEIAKWTALEDTRKLFYDLAKKSNAADMAKHIFPFADAWWEILSTWGRLLNPYKNYGQALRNIRRAEQSIAGMRQSGWFQEDDFGNEVFAWWPSTSMLVEPLLPEGTRLQQRAGLAQAMFLDVANPRNILFPGTSPFVQLPAALVSPLLPEPLRNAAEWFTFGEFPPTNVEDPEAIWHSFLPSYMRKFAESRYGFGPAFRQRWADDIIMVAESNVNSGNPLYDWRTADGQRRALEDARRVGGWLSIASAFDAFLFPASAQIKAEVFSSMAAGPDGDHWMTTASIGREFAIARQYFDEDKAVQYIQNKFGIDPYSVTGTTRRVFEHPVTEEAGKFLDDRPEMLTYMPLTLMSWIPETDGDPWSQRHWSQSFKEDPQGRERRERLDEREALQLILYQQGDKAYANLNDQYDQALAELRASVGNNFDNDYYRFNKRQLDQWRRTNISNLISQYQGYYPGDGVDGLGTRPSYRQLFGELETLGTDGTTANRYARTVDSELVDFVEYMVTNWKKFSEASEASGRSQSWWRTSDALEDRRPSQLRELYIQGLEWKLNQLTSDTAIEGARQITERILTFLLEGYDLDDPILIEITEPPVPSRQEVRDILQPTGGRI